MTGDRIYINEQILRGNVLTFLRSPSGQPILEIFDFGFFMCLALAAVACGIRFCMLPTIVGTIAGVKMLWTVLSGEPFKPMWNNPKSHPERLIPLIGHLIIIGPDRKHALAIGTFRPSNEYSVDWLARKAALFGEVYTAPEHSIGPEFVALRELLRDDTYHPHRRRRVPESYAEGMKLFLFDVEVDPDQACMTPYSTAMCAFVADFGDMEDEGAKGEIAGIPWHVVNDAVHIVGK